jgi:hypothetical protein
MKSHITARFRKAFQRLPGSVQQQARAAYRLFKQNPYHPGLRFKPVHPSRPIYSVRIGIDYRALGVRATEDIIWFWIGSHSDYDKLISRL